MRDNFDGIRLDETNDPEGWMGFHHAEFQLRGDPVAVDKQPPLNLENEEDTHETMVGLADRADRQPSSSWHLQCQSHADSKKGPLSQFLADCLIHQGQNDQQILMDLVKQLPYR